MAPWEIALLVIGIIVAIYLLLVLVALTFILIFKRIFNKHNKALAVATASRYDYIGKLITSIQQSNVEINLDIVNLFKSIDKVSIVNHEFETRMKTNSDLTNIKNYLFFVMNRDKDNISDEAFHIKEAIVEIDNNYRNLIAMYNADVLGFNYWINFLAIRCFTKLFKVKSKKLI